jgi:N-acyl-phosphatidylethanolamine-hydrolysing phospholipase D
MSTKTFKNPPNSPKPNTNLYEWLIFIVKHLFKKSPKVVINHVISNEKVLQRMAELTGKDTVTWLGHNTFLFYLDGKTILTDPFFSEYASPLPGIGQKRFVPPALSIKQLPKIDFIILTHNHYDHLDIPSIKALPNKHTIQVITPLNLGKFFTQHGYQNVYEFDWHEQRQIDNLTITALPAIHFSKRGLFDRNKALWANFAIKTKQLNIFFGCDTGYGSIYKELGIRYPAFNYAFLDIGAYAPRSIMQSIHINPEEAVQIGLDIKAKTLIAMHWGTIQLAEEPPLEPPQRFRTAGLQAGYSEKNLWVLKIGETRELNSV